MPQPNKYLTLIQDEDAANRDRLNTAALATKDANPDVRATSMKLGAETGVPTEVAERNPAELQTLRDQNRYARLLVESPHTAEWMANPEKMAIAKDDVETLGKVEDTFLRGGRGPAYRAMGRAALTGARELAAGVPALGQGIYGAMATPFALLGQAEKKLGGVGYASTVEEYLLGHARTLEAQSEDVAGPLPADASALRRGVRSGLQSFGQQAPLMAAGILTGQPGLILPSMVASVQGQKFQQAREQNLSPLDAATFSVGHGAVEWGTEKYPLGLLLKGLSKSDFLKFAGSEIAGEQAATIGQDMLDWAGLPENADKPFSAYIEARPGAAAETLVATIIGSGGNIAVVQTAKMLASGEDATRKQAQLDDMVKLATDSKLRTRASGEFENFTKKLADNSDVKQVFLPVDKMTEFFQSENIPPDVVAEHLTDDAGAWAEAQVTGRLQVPVENFLSRLEPEYMEALSKDALLSADQMTKEEQADWDKNSPDIIKAFTEAMGQAVPTDSDSRGAVYDDVLGQLTGLGVEVSVAEKQAQLTQAVFRTLGERTGMDGTALYNRYGVRITKEGGESLRRGAEIDAQLDPLIDRLRAGDIPSQKDAFGSSLMEMLREFGIKDEGGELAARDVDKGLKPFQRALIKEDGLSLEHAAQMAFERGYMEDVTDIANAGHDALLALIDQEMGGEAVFSRSNEQEKSRTTRDTLLEMQDVLERAGVDLTTASNAEVKAALRGTELEQSAVEFKDALAAGLSEGYVISKTGDRYAVHAPDGTLIDDTFRNKSGAETVVAQSAARNQKQVTLFQGGAQTDTPEFKRWFGDSKVVDENGEPLVVYHETNADFDEFDTDSSEMGSHFGTTQQLSSFRHKRKGMRVVPAYLSIKNPLRMEDLGSWPADQLAMRLASDGLGVLTDAEVNEVLLAWQGGEGGPSGYKAAALRSQSLLQSILKKKGYDGIVYLNRREGMSKADLARADEIDGLSDENFKAEVPYAADSYIAFRPEQIKSAIGNRGTFDASDPSILNQRGANTPRGRITFGADRQFTIELLKNADLSTFLHESGHLYLEVFADIAESPDAPQQIKDDWAATLKFLGVESRADIGTDQHELWAETFEQYLHKGEAPSPALKSAFARFRAWLNGVYRSLKNLNIELRPEVRDVFDRLIATDDEIAAARHAQVMRPMFKDAKTAGMNPAQFEAYTRMQNEARVEGENAVARDLLKHLKREALKEYRAARKRVRAEVAAEVDSLPAQKALALLGRGKMPDGSALPEGIEPIKLDRAALQSLYGAEFLKRLPRPYVYAAEGGVHPDLAAGWLGFSSGDALVEALANARPRNELIDDLTDARMRDIYPDPATDGSLAERAMRAVHNGRESDVLQAEAEALARLIRESDKGTGLQRHAASQAVMRAYARTIVAGKRVRDLNPNAYLVAGHKSARLAMEAAGKQDWDTAFAEHERRRVNYHLYIEARRQKERLAKVTPFLRRFTKSGLREKIGKAEGELLEKIDVVLGRLNIQRIPADVDESRMRDAIRQDIRDLTIAGNADTITAIGSNGDPRSLTVSQVLGLRNVVKQYEVLANAHYLARVNGEQVVIDEAADEMAAAASNNGRKIPLYVGDPTIGERAKNFAYQMLLVNRRITDIARSLDSEASFGAWTQRLIVPIRRAIAEKLDPLTLKARQDMAALYRKHYSLKELGRFRKVLLDTGLDYRMTQDSLLSLALNWGNEGNRTAILAMRHRDTGAQLFTEQKVNELLSRLSERDMAFVQDAWDYLDSYWPQIRETEKRRRGIAPQKVQASPFTVTTADGKQVTMRGGYYPLRYDARTDIKARQDEADDFYKKFQVGTNVRAATRAGATIERVGSGGRGVSLSLNVINAHLNDIIRDISIGDEINYAVKVLNRPQVRQSLIQTGNYDVLNELHRWLQDAATGELAARHALDRVAQFTRTGFVTSKLAWSFTTSALQLTGIAQSMAVIGSTHMAKAALDFSKNPAAAHRLAMENSAWLRDRYILHSWNKDVSDTRRYLQSMMGGVPTQSAIVLDMVTHSFFWPIMKMQQQVDVITWFAAYRRAQEEGIVDHDKSVLYADAMVEKSQTSGQFADRSAIERGSVGQARQSKSLMLFTALISYQLAKANIAYSKSREFAMNPSFMGAVTLTTDITLLYAVEAILAGFIRGRLPDEDDDEGWGEWMLGQITQSFLSGIVFAREGVSALYGGGNTPIGSLAHDVVNVYKQSAQGDVDAAMIKAYNNVGGQLFHYPSAQTNRAIDAYWADKNGEDIAPYEYLTGPRKD